MIKNKKNAPRIETEGMPVRFKFPAFYYRWFISIVRELKSAMEQHKIQFLKVRGVGELVITPVQTPDGLMTGIIIENNKLSSGQRPDISGIEPTFGEIEGYIKNNKAHANAQIIDESIELIDANLEKIERALAKKGVSLEQDEPLILPNGLLTIFYFDELRDSRKYLHQTDYESYVNLSIKAMIALLPEDRWESFAVELMQVKNLLSFGDEFRKVLDSEEFESLKHKQIDNSFRSVNNKSHIMSPDFNDWFYSQERKFSHTFVRIPFIYIMKLMIKLNESEIDLGGNLGTLVAKTYASNSFDSIQYGLILDNSEKNELTGLNLENGGITSEDRLAANLIVDEMEEINRAIKQLKNTYGKPAPDYLSFLAAYASIAFQCFLNIALVCQGLETEVQKSQYINSFLKYRYCSYQNFDSGCLGYYLIQEIHVMHLILLEYLGDYDQSFLTMIKPIEELITK